MTDRPALPPAESERLTAAGIAGALGYITVDGPIGDECEEKRIDRELDQLYAARSELAELQKRVSGVAARMTEHGAQYYRLGRLTQNTITRLSMAGRAEVYEQAAAELLAILGPSGKGER